MKSRNLSKTESTLPLSPNLPTWLLVNACFTAPLQGGAVLLVPLELLRQLLLLPSARLPQQRRPLPLDFIFVLLDGF